MTRVNDKEQLVKNILKVTKDNKAENRRIRNVAHPKDGKHAVNVSALFIYSKDLMQLSERLDNFENAIINVLEKETDEAFRKKMKGRLN